MKAVQLHSGVKMLLKLFHDGGAQHRLGPVREYSDGHAKQNKREQDRTGNPLQPRTLMPFCRSHRRHSTSLPTTIFSGLLRYRVATLSRWMRFAAKIARATLRLLVSLVPRLAPHSF
jgi:hypothetical protein